METGDITNHYVLYFFYEDTVRTANLVNFLIALSHLISHVILTPESKPNKAQNNESLATQTIITDTTHYNSLSHLTISCRVKGAVVDLQQLRSHSYVVAQLLHLQVVLSIRWIWPRYVLLFAIAISTY